MLVIVAETLRGFAISANAVARDCVIDVLGAPGNALGTADTLNIFFVDQIKIVLLVEQIDRQGFAR